jgi:CheY-like chemotaxis protein
VVDDNEINRFVAVEHLEALGYCAETVEGGAEAVDAVTANTYALVLMDCQMPGMDGYSAAREIRQREAGQARLPIIAVTAHALPGEREHVLAAGMDDYIAKPVTPDILDQTLARWIGRPTRMPSVRPAALPALAMPPVAQSDFDPKVPVSPRLMGIFLRVAPGQLVELRAQLVARSHDDARAKAHKLKGGLYAVGAARLADSVEALRVDIADERWAEAEQRFVAIEQRFEALSEQLSVAVQAAERATAS